MRAFIKLFTLLAFFGLYGETHANTLFVHTQTGLQVFDTETFESVYSLNFKSERPEDMYFVDGKVGIPTPEGDIYIDSETLLESHVAYPIALFHAVRKQTGFTNVHRNLIRDAQKSTIFDGKSGSIDCDNIFFHENKLYLLTDRTADVVDAETYKHLKTIKFSYERHHPLFLNGRFVFSQPTKRQLRCFDWCNDLEEKGNFRQYSMNYRAQFLKNAIVFYPTAKDEFNPNQRIGVENYTNNMMNTHEVPLETNEWVEAVYPYGKSSFVAFVSRNKAYTNNQKYKLYTITFNGDDTNKKVFSHFGYTNAKGPVRVVNNRMFICDKAHGIPRTIVFIDGLNSDKKTEKKELKGFFRTATDHEFITVSSDKIHFYNRIDLSLKTSTSIESGYIDSRLLPKILLVPTKKPHERNDDEEEEEDEGSMKKDGDIWKTFTEPKYHYYMTNVRVKYLYKRLSKKERENFFYFSMSTQEELSKMPLRKTKAILNPGGKCIMM